MGEIKIVYKMGSFIHVLKVARYSNGHKYPKQKQRTPNLTFFAQIGLAIMFTTNSCVKHRMSCKMLTPFRT